MISPKSPEAPAIPYPYPISTRPYRQGLAERLYLPLVGGLLVTLRHFLRNLFRPGAMPTIKYPEERRRYGHRFRGHHILTTRPDGSVRCVACFLCAQACPAECIHIEAGEHPDVNIEKYPAVYEIDMLRCVFCGYCVDACPEEAIIMSNNYDMAYFNRDQTVVGKADLMKPYTFDEKRLGYRPRYPEEELERAKMRREAFSLVEAARQRQARPGGPPPASPAGPPPSPAAPPSSLAGAPPASLPGPPPS
ncbi:MAG: NADH-quinone oxidoreductase subunit I [Acidobacteria bacterium]|nr:NADH-quinone oxidoreductase subunit I [Acidobacteriota bacterium]